MQRRLMGNRKANRELYELSELALYSDICAHLRDLRFLIPIRQIRPIRGSNVSHLRSSASSVV